MTRNWFNRRRRERSKSTVARNRRLRVQCLEDRTAPATFTVTTTLDTIDEDDHKLSLREAVIRTNDLGGPDTIVVPAGVIKFFFIQSIDITDSVTIRGAGAGKSIVDAQRLDRVFDIRGTAPSSIEVVLQGLTVRNGNVTGSGGGILVANADLVVRGSTVTGNRASTAGAGIANVNGTGDVTLIRSTVAGNVAGGNGGGIFLFGTPGVLAIQNSTVRRNLGGSGGGIYATTSTLLNSTVNDNFASAIGGGIRAVTAVTLTNSTVGGNMAGVVGGGLMTSGTATMTNCTVSGNSAFSGDGGGILASTANLTNCTVSGNSAIGSGGGVNAITATLLNCAVVENNAHTGGGLFHNPGGTFNVRNTIVALNLVDFTGTGPNVSGDFTSGGHNLIGDGTGGTGFTNDVNGDMVGTPMNPIDPKLGPLANNGGRTKTHALLAGSRAIDRGDNSILPPTDQRGFPRKKDGNFDGVTVVDIGAFER
jgi:hypothetical protein